MVINAWLGLQVEGNDKRTLIVPEQGTCEQASMANSVPGSTINLRFSSPSILLGDFITNLPHYSLYYWLSIIRQD